MNFEFKHFNDLTVDELYDILKLRAEIFVVEQNCVYNDLDKLDKEAMHMYYKKGDKIIAYSRLLKPGTRFPDYSIGKSCSEKRRKRNRTWNKNDGGSKKIHCAKLESRHN